MDPRQSPPARPPLGSVALIGAAAVVLAGAVLIGAPPWLLLALIVAAAALASWTLWTSLAREAARFAPVRDAAEQLARAQLALTGDTPARPSEAPEQLARAIDSARDSLQAELELRQRQLDVANAVVASVDQAILAVDSAGALVLVNPAAEAFVGVPATRLLGKGIDRAITYADIIRTVESARSGLPTRQTIRLVQAGGPRYIDAWAGNVALGLPAPTPAQSLTVLTLRDITAEAQALRVRTEFVANASHELRTPIAAMRVAIDTLSALGPDDEPAREKMAQIVASNIDRLEELIRDLLDLSRAEATDAPTELTNFEFNQLVSTLEPGFRRALDERRLTLSWDLAPDVQHLHTDRKLVLLILQNLIENACKFAYEGTTINVRARATGRLAHLEVSDQGIGIPLDQQARIFERFYQVDLARTGVGASRRGTGLGLAIVKHAVKRLGGTVRVQSVWKQGTTMIVELPNALEAA